MRLLVPWLREYVESPASADDVAAGLSRCGFAAEEIDGDVIDLEVTANRPDCLSVYGLAREAAAAFDRPLAAPPGSAALTVPDAGAVRVSIGDAGCGRYALAIAEVTVGPSPDWLAERLTAAGMRPINNVVDITNYVMLETGQPMHAFDVERLAGPEIRVRRARPEEALTTLDGADRTLDDTMLVIADRDRAVAIAGVMGGADSEVSDTTTRIAIESAWFRPATVRATSRALGLKTEASIRFERGADQEAPVLALRRAIALLEQTGGGRAASQIVDVHPRPPARATVVLRRDRLSRLLGDTVPDQDVTRILSALGFSCADTPEGWRVEVPSFRGDVTREADLIEEVGRHWGFDRVPPTFPALHAMPAPSAPGVMAGRTVRRVLCGAGLQEAVTFTFIEADAAAPFGDAARFVRIENPLSEKFAVLRPSLMPGLLDSLIFSRRRETSSVQLFEVGAVFSTDGESRRVGWVMSGAHAEHWSARPEPLTFSDARGVAELLAELSGMPLHVEADESLPGLVPGRRARVVIDGRTAGWVGQLDPRVVAARGLPDSGAVFGGEWDLAWIVQADTSGLRPIAPLPRFPSAARDLSLLIDERLPAADVRGTIRASAPATLVAVAEFDRYQGKGVPEGKVSLSVRLTFRDAQRTLTDSEVQQAVDAIVAALTTEHGAVLRGADEQAE